LIKNKKSYKSSNYSNAKFWKHGLFIFKIDLIDSKIKENDTVFFLKEIIGIKNPKEVNKIEIKPIIDVYAFIGNKPENFESYKKVDG